MMLLLSYALKRKTVYGQVCMTLSSQWWSHPHWRGKDAYSVAFTGLLMALLPQYLSEDEDFNDHYIEYIFAEHADLVEELLEKHNLVKDMLQGFTGKLH
jgi:hypothetical protein